MERERERGGGGGGENRGKQWTEKKKIHSSIREQIRGKKYITAGLNEIFIVRRILRKRLFN